MIDKGKLISLGSAEMLRHRNDKILLNISLPDACILISQLQLAARHPKNPAAVIALQHCETIIRQIEKLSKDLADFCRLGYDPKYDDAREKK